MKRLRTWLSSRLFDDVTRRAIAETLADDHYVRRAGRGVSSRVRTAVALVRIVFVSLLAIRWVPITRHLGGDVRVAVRRLRATPGASLLAIATLAAGIGVTTAVYAAMYAALLRPPDVANLDRVVEVRHTAHQRGGMSWPDVRAMTSMQTVFDRVGGYVPWYGSAVAFGRSQEVFGEVVTGEYFDVLGVLPAAGRLIQPADDRAAAPPVVAISERLWTNIFAREPDTVGRVVRLNDQAFVVVGIVAASYRGGQSNSSLRPTDLWVALGGVEHLSGFEELIDRDDLEQWRFNVKARLAPRRTVADGRADVTRIAAQLDATTPIGKPGDRVTSRNTRQAWTVIPARDAGLKEWAANRLIATTVMVTLGLVMLVVCANLVNLTLAQASSRRHESAVRLALGAPKWRLLRESLVECGLLAIAGGATGLLLARALMVWLTRDLPLNATFVITLDPRLDPAVLAFACGATFVALVVAVIVSSWSVLRVDLRSTTSGHGISISAPRWRGRRVLIAAQVTLSVGLVLLAATSAGRAVEIAHEDVGIDFGRLATLAARTTPQYDPSRVQGLVEHVAAEMRRRPDVESVAIASGVRHIEPESAYLSRPGRTDTVWAHMVASSATIFPVLGARVVRGRPFSADEVGARAPVAVLNQTAATELFGAVDPIDQTFQLTRQRAAGEPEAPARTLTVIGIVDDRGPHEMSDSGDVYVPIGSDFMRHVMVVVRASGTPADLLVPLRETMRRLDPDVAITSVGTGLELGRPELLYRRVIAGLTAGLGVFALMLALIGLFGVLAHVMRRRVREIGVRIALGATTRQIARRLLGEGLRPVFFGVIVGTAFGVLTRMALRPAFLEAVPAVDLWALLIVPMPIVLAGALACYLPVRRAARVDPNVALREM